MELAALLELKWKDIENDKALVKSIANCYKQETGTSACCLKTLKAFFKKHKNQLKSEAMKKETTTSENFKMKKGVIRYVTSLDLHVSNSNLTDENAVAMLKEKPHRIADFETYPENLDDLLGGAALPKKPKPTKAPAKPAIKKGK